MRFASIAICFVGLVAVIPTANSSQAADLPVISTWIGNTWDGVRQPQMPLTADDICVSGDGIVTMTTHYNEGGLCMLILREGHVFGFSMHSTETFHAAASPDGTRLFVGAKGEYGRGVAQFSQFGELQDASRSLTRAGPLSDRDIGGLAWQGKYLYATEPSEKGFNGIWVFEAAKWAPNQQPSYKIDRSGKPKLGRIAVDSQGNPWVIEGSDVVHLQLESGNELARIRMPSPQMPAALAVDPTDRLLVADRGIDCDIKIFDKHGHAVGTVGAKGGFAAGPVRGLIGPLRFDQPTGLGIDKNNNLYVYSAGGHWPQTVRLESYAWNGTTWSKLNWKAEGLIGGDTVFLDPADETRGYNSGSQFKLDWSQPPGKESSFYATTVSNYDEAGNHTADPRCNLGVWWGSHGLRRIHGQKFLYGSAACDLVVYRFAAATGEMAIPSVFLAPRSPHFGEGAGPGWPAFEPQTDGTWLWTDTNGNGKFDKGEYQLLSHIDHSEVDDAGTIYYFPTDFQREPRLRIWPVGAELDTAGNPVYDPKAIIDYPPPRGWAKPRYLWMDPATGDLVVSGFRDGANDVSMSYYAAWRKNPKMAPTWTVEHLGPATRFEDSGYDTTGDHVGTLQVHGAYVVVPSVLSNQVRIYRRTDGSLVGTLLRHTLAPNTTLDGNLEFGVYQRKCGEFILTGEDFLQNKCLVYRWMPDGPNLDFQRPAIAAGSEELNPAGAAWTFEGASGLYARGGKAEDRRSDAEGRQGCAIRKGGSFYQAIPFDKDGRCAVSFHLDGDATQRVEVRLDNRVVGTFTPGSDSAIECKTTPESIEQGGHVIKFVATGAGTARVNGVRLEMIAPEPPTQAAATAEDGQVSLSWQPSSSATGYRVYRTEVAISRFEPIAAQLDSTAFTDNHVTTDRTYLYRVTAINNAGESAPAPTLSVLVPNPKAGASPFEAGPQMVGASGANREIHLRWRLVESATGYTVWRGNQAAGPMTVVAENVTTRPYVDASVVAGKKYFYRVSATKQGAVSPLSFPTSAIAADNPNLDFESPALPAKAQTVNPAGAGWKFEGRAGIIAYDNPRVAYRTMQGKQGAFLARESRMSQELEFTAGRHLLRFRSVQLEGDVPFRVLLDGRQIGIFEPSHSPQWMLTVPFTTTAGRHGIAFEPITPPDAFVMKADHTCLIDSVSIEDGE